MSFIGGTFGAQPFWNNGPAPGCFYNFPGPQQSSQIQPTDYTKRTQNPTTTGSSVIGIRFDKGVMIAADTLGSYGSLARYIGDCPRIIKVNDRILFGAGGDYADFQYMESMIEAKVREEECLDDDFQMQPSGLYSWVTRVMYRKRSKMDPLWNNFIIGGVQRDGTPFLGTVDKLGTAYQDRLIATGFGNHLAIPLFRELADSKLPELTQEKARELITNAMQVLYYRDARSSPKYQLGICTAEGIEILNDLKVNQNWEVAHMIV
ncbi:proteasome subunit beta type-4 [Ctenocephalides felis]|uniref:proteasome subunit beta type-4 n=1 Tax=Ctenocephalides felis TaxID=7515 RepID=UPI000E6E3E55|nr:proteasome subunit beta type-4 [Ctenocephalides felis]